MLLMAFSSVVRPAAQRAAGSALPLAAVAAVAFLCAGPGPAEAQSPMIQGWLAANTACKAGPADGAKALKACARRDDLGAKLKRRGCEYQEDGDWWRCPH